MERNANYALVGGLALLLLAGLAVFVVWLAGAQFNRQYDNYRIVFQGSVQGLSEGGDVYYNGIRVGEVTRLTLDARDPNRVVAAVRLNGDTPVKTDSIAQLEPLGITGVNIIQITAGKPSSPLLKDESDAAVPTILSRPGALAGLLSGGGTLLERAVDTLDRVNSLLSNENIASLTTTLDNVETISTDLQGRAALLDDVERTLVAVEGATVEIGRLANSSRGLVDGDVAVAVRDVGATAAELKLAATDARGLVADLRTPARDFATTGLPQLTQSLVSLQEAAESLERVVTRIGENPRALITTGEGAEREVAP